VIKTFENFDTTIPGSEKAYAAFKALADGTTDKPFLFCIGGVGNGKTHLIMATVNCLKERRIEAWYWTAGAFFNYLKSGINPPPGFSDLDTLMYRMCHCPVLVLDDLGVEYGTKWEYAQLDQIIDARYRDELITIVSTNKGIEELIPIMERVISRFTDTELSQMVLNKAGDYRKKRH